MPISAGALLSALTLGLAALAPREAPGEDAAARAAYHLVKTVPLGAPDRWDYLAFDSSSKRVFIAHGDRLTVVSGATGENAGEVLGMPGGTHGVVFVPEAGKGYTDDGRAGQAVAFDLASLKTGARIPAAEDADGVVYDRASGHVLVIDGDPGEVTVIDPKTDTAIAAVSGGGKLEFGVSDGLGHVYVNGEEKHEIVRIDSLRNVVDAHWPMPTCLSPHGLAIDLSSRRLFSSCANRRLIVVNADTGSITASLPIGRGSDAAAFDPSRRLIFSSDGGEGSISVIREDGPDNYSVLPSIRTAVSARTMTLDPETGRLFVVAAKTDPPAVAGGRPRAHPGSLQLLIIDPN